MKQTLTEIRWCQNMTSESHKTVRFFFDYISPYSYLAWTQLPSLIKKYGVNIHLCPVLFAGLLKVHNQRGPAEIPAKRRWMIDNVLRKAASLAVSISPPTYHPFNPLLALRATVAAKTTEELRLITEACFNAVWVDSLHIVEPDVLISVLNLADLNGQKLVEQADTDVTKRILQQNTDEATSAGVFGVPTFVVDDQLFWGVGDVPFLEAWLSGDDLLEHEKSQLWRNGVEPSAQRRTTQDR